MLWIPKETHYLINFFGRIKPWQEPLTPSVDFPTLYFLPPKETLLNVVFIIPLLFKTEMVFLNFVRIVLCAVFQELLFWRNWNEHMSSRAAVHFLCDLLFHSMNTLHFLLVNIWVVSSLLIL